MSPHVGGFSNACKIIGGCISLTVHYSECSVVLYTLVFINVVLRHLLRQILGGWLAPGLDQRRLWLCNLGPRT